MTVVGKRLASSLVAAALASAGLVAQQRDATDSSAADPAVMRALFNAQPGIYAVATAGTVQPGDEKTATAVFVQADAYRRAAGGVQVSVVVGAAVQEPWVLQMRVVAAGPGRGDAPVETFTGEAGTVRQIREFTLQPARYVVEAVLAHRSGAGWLGTVVKQPLEVPNLAGGQLVVTPVVLGDSISLAGPQEGDRAFVFGPSSLTPSVVNRFGQSDSLTCGFRVYGWKADAEAKPDLAVEYVFYQRIGSGLRFYNKTKIQSISPKTLSRVFDGRKGVVGTGHSMRLTNFPPGEFELTVRVQDRRSQTTPAAPGRTGPIRRGDTRLAAAEAGGPGTVEQKIRFIVNPS
jgi:hypothetical protein